MRWFIPFLVGCNSSSSNFVGEVEGSDAVVGISTHGEAGQLYLCGGVETMDSLNRWFDLTVLDTLTGSSEDWSVEATEPAAWKGTITSPEGDTFSFATVPGEGPDGVYEPEEDVSDCPAGAVVSGGGKDLQGVACPKGFAPAQVVPVGLISKNGGRISVRTDGDPPLEFAVVPVQP